MAIGRVAQLWRYPVKGMRGEAVSEVFLGFAGVYGDRVFAFTSPTRRAGFPFVSCNQQPSMLTFTPRFRASGSRAPANLAEAEAIEPGVSPLYADLEIEVELPTGEVLAIDAPAVAAAVAGDRHGPLSLRRSHRSMTDCRPVSLISNQTIAAIGDEVGAELDRQRFRGNLYVELDDSEPFGEDRLVGETVRVGDRAVLAVLERDPRCAVISIDPDTGERDNTVLATVVANHANMAGVYAAVLVEGLVRAGDPMVVL